jgi:hypothetical protein
VADPRNASIDAAAYAVYVNGQHVSTVVETEGEWHTITTRLDMAWAFPGVWKPDGMGGTVLRMGDVLLSVVPVGGGPFDCALVGTVRGMHYDVRFRAPTLHAAGKRFREVVL